MAKTANLKPAETKVVKQFIAARAPALAVQEAGVTLAYWAEELAMLVRIVSEGMGRLTDCPGITDEQCRVAAEGALQLLSARAESFMDDPLGDFRKAVRDHGVPVAEGR